MVFMVLLALVLIAGAAAAVAVQRHAAGGAGVVPLAPPTPDIDARAEGERWVERLGGSLSTLDAGGDKAAGQALADANERYRAARGQLAAAGSPAQYAMVTQTAVEGLYYVRGARTALGLDPGPALPDLGAATVTARDGRVTVDDRTYAVSDRPGGATPYYYPGGVVGGRRVPGGWYSRPWWKTALVAGAAGAGGDGTF
ncbi:hypothetical protein OG426_27735 [Streptomyces canus]|uniref:hypothetical protein n=1 Tax=Streptomyces canus TaxID=58343 RepID=UPI00224EA890|nr:hypothetical protein [Streptomyces canus]MCX4858742.1 hypothetical protein [Streptomyces canus]WSW35974.1 hypothetical protein OG426_27735 [Streptomyces canus]